MNAVFKKTAFVMLVLAGGLAWLDAQAGKPVKITVTEAIPSEALQGDALPVRIRGTGFDPGSSVRFIVTDSRDDSQIEVGTVIYDSDTGDLVAQVKVKDQALVVDYDVEVKTSSGRRGKGTTLFRVRERVGTNDPCLTSTSPFPAFMFWRNLGNDTQTDYTIYLASEDGVCERALYDVPPDSVRVFYWESAFNYDSTNNRGYVTWIREGSLQNPEPDTLWLQEFTVQGNTISLLPGPELILMHPDFPDANIGFKGFDISPDMGTLAYTYWWLELEGAFTQVHVVDLDTCRFPNPPCTPGADTMILDAWEAYDPHRGPMWRRVTWDTLGERLYLQGQPGLDVYRPWSIDTVTNVAGTWVVQQLLNEADYPEYRSNYRMSSGILGGREKLAFRHTPDGECSTISVIDVAACEAGPTLGNPRPCAAEAQLLGRYPAWTDHGTIVYWEMVRGKPYKKVVCRATWLINEWDPASSEVFPLLEGINPDTP